MALNFPLFSKARATREGSHKGNLPFVPTDVRSSQHTLKKWDAGFSCRRPVKCVLGRNRRVSAPLSPIFYLFLAPAGKLYLKVQHLLAHDETYDASPPPMVGKRRPGPKHPQYGIPTEHWPMVIHRIEEQKEPLRTVVAAYGVSHETIRRLIRAATKGHVQQEAHRSNSS